MTLLGGWLRQLILIIFLAILADFLLPTKAMQKYVRMVMGLAIIAAMLQPILPLFRGGFANTLAEQATSEILANSTVTKASTYDIAGLKQQLQAEQTKTETALLEQRLKEATASACHVAVTSVHVQTDGSGKVTSVTVLTPVTNRATKEAVQQFVCSQLALGTTQVKVMSAAGGGDSAGF